MLKNQQNYLAGFAALPTLLLVGGIVVSISAALTASVYLYVNSTYGANLSLTALSVAKSGIYDGAMIIARDKSLVSASYNLPIGKYSVAVTICRDTSECGGSGNFLISSIASVLTRRKQMQAIVAVDSTTGVMKLQKLIEVAL